MPPARLRSLFLAVATAGLCLTGCPAEPPAAAPPMEPVGARAIRLHDGVPLRHYGPEHPPALRVDGPPDGYTLRLRTATEAHALATRVEHLGQYTFLVAEPPADPALEGPLQLEAVRGGRPVAGFTVWWDSPRSGEQTSALEALARAVGSRGWHTAEVVGWRLLARLDTALDRPTEAARALRIAAQRERQRGRLAAAGDLIERAVALDTAVGALDGRAYGAYARSGLARLAGELRAAEAAADEAVQLAEKAWMPALVDYGAVLGAVIGSELGHHTAARATLDGLRSRVAGMPPDLQVNFAGNRGWVLLEGWRRGAFEVDPAEIERAFTTALAAAEGRPERQANQHANLAALARMTGDRAALDRQIAAHDRLDPERQQYAGMFVGLLDGHRALLDGDGATALARFEAVEHRLRIRVDDPVGAYLWQARLGQARAHRRLGRGSAALASYRAALAIVDRAAARTALQGQRALFFADRAALFDEAFGAALAEGDTAAAFAVADAARARVVRDLEVGTRLGRLDPAQRAVWSDFAQRYLALRAAYEAERTAGELLAADGKAHWQAGRRAARAELQAAFDAAHDWLDRAAPMSPGGAEVAEVQARLGADEGLWLAHRRGAEWHGFLVTADGLSHHVGERPIPDDSTLPAPIRHLALVGVPPSASPALWTRVSTASWTHAGALRRATAADGPRIVLGDPDQSLPGARAEARSIAGQIDAEHLEGAGIDRAVALDALRRASAVHFAGHGVLVPASPWDAHLRLAAGERLTTEDVLMARPTTRLVVLSSCETGREALLADDPLGARITLSLADAFVAAGVGSVLAAERPVPDAAALDLMRRFYAAGGLEQPAEALRRAALDAKAAGDPLWDAFHLRGAR